MYTASDKRYEKMLYNRCGESGLKLPAVSLGLWHNFGDTGNFENMRQICFTAFDNGITHFDLANNYGPEPGSAEKNFGRILREDLSQYRDELIISTKAGYDMWEGPYGNWGSRKYLLASLDQSLKTDLLDTIARRLGVSFPDLRDWCPLLSLQALLEVDNRAFPVEEWNRALAYLLGRPCAFSYVFEAKAYTKTVIRRWWF